MRVNLTIKRVIFTRLHIVFFNKRAFRFKTQFITVYPKLLHSGSYFFGL
jgi:hypothetical protein